MSSKVSKIHLAQISRIMKLTVNYRMLGMRHKDINVWKILSKWTKIIIYHLQ